LQKDGARDKSGEVGLVIADEYLAVTDFNEE
jgi:hypothetical protein